MNRVLVDNAILPWSPRRQPDATALGAKTGDEITRAQGDGNYERRPPLRRTGRAGVANGRTRSPCQHVAIYQPASSGGRGRNVLKSSWRLDPAFHVWPEEDVDAGTRPA